MWLRKKHKIYVRDIARKQYLDVCSLYYNPKQLKGGLKKNVIEQVRLNSVNQVTRELHNSKQFTGILSSLFLAIAIKLAVKLIEKWIEDNLFEATTLSLKYKYGEPGYVKTK